MYNIHNKKTQNVQVETLAHKKWKKAFSNYDDCQKLPIYETS